VDVARDRSFKRLLAGKAGPAKESGEALWWNAKSTESSWQTPADVGIERVFYWRVAAVDGVGFPGAASESRAIRVRGNVESLYMVVRSPAEGALLRTSPVTIEGSVGSQCTLVVDGAAVEVQDGGAFRVEKPLSEGKNTFRLEVTDKNESRTTKSLSITYAPDRPAPIEYASDLLSEGPGRFVTRDSAFDLQGRTTPGAGIRVEAETGGFSAGTAAAPDGAFHVQVPSGQPEAEYRLLVTVPSGFVTEDKFRVRRDDIAPELSVTSPFPAVTASSALTIRGRVEGATGLVVNKGVLTLANGDFEASVELVAGRNPIELVARDAAGNEARWGQTVVLDREPPKLLGSTLTRTRGPDGGSVEVTVRASDDSGLKRTAEAGLTAGSVLRVVALRLDRGAGEYRGEIALPRGPESALSLTYIILEDQAGNRKTFVKSASAPARPPSGRAASGQSKAHRSRVPKK
jgi:hypothetical protein